MFSGLKSAWNNLVGPRSGTSAEAAAETVEYKGYRIKPAPQQEKGQHRTAGIIEKDTPDGRREHRFVRADTFSSRDEAVAFSILKAKQIIDHQGDRMFA
jgi:hypothetical protein